MILCSLKSYSQEAYIYSCFLTAIEDYINPNPFKAKVYLLPNTSEVLSVEFDPYNYLSANYSTQSSVLFSN